VWYSTQIRTIAGDSEPITALCFSRDGRSLFAASRSLTAKRYEVATGAELRSWKPHEAPVADMAVDGSGCLLATASADRSARVWDVEKVRVSTVRRENPAGEKEDGRRRAEAAAREPFAGRWTPHVAGEAAVREPFAGRWTPHVAGEAAVREPFAGRWTPHVAGEAAVREPFAAR
jgi:hypothetical protein